MTVYQATKGAARPIIWPVWLNSQLSLCLEAPPDIDQRYRSPGDRGQQIFHTSFTDTAVRQIWDNYADLAFAGHGEYDK